MQIILRNIANIVYLRLFHCDNGVQNEIKFVNKL